MTLRISLSSVLLLASASSASAVTIRWWGQACFTIEADNKAVLLIDPYHPKQTGYKPFDVKPDVICITHEHFDHNDISWAKGSPKILRGLKKGGRAVRKIDVTVKNIKIKTVPSRHYQNPKDSGRGLNAIFVIEADGLRIVHLGDLGQARLTDEQVKQIGRVDVLLIPVGGTFTIDGPQAAKIVAQLECRQLVVPMHYRTKQLVDGLRKKLQGPERFLKTRKHVQRSADNQIKVQFVKEPPRCTCAVLSFLPAKKLPATK